MTTTPDLIESLAADARLVKRLRPPGERALLWLAVLGAAIAIMAWVGGYWPRMATRLEDTRFALEMAGTFATGVCGIVAAFYVSLPDRSSKWLWLPAPAFALWLASSSYGCYRDWIAYTPDNSLTLGVTAHCFLSILLISIPLGIVLTFALRKVCPINPVPVMAVGGLGVAGLAAATLQFFHPFEVTLMDLAFHMAAVIVVVAVSAAIGIRRRAALTPV